MNGLAYFGNKVDKRDAGIPAVHLTALRKSWKYQQGPTSRAEKRGFDFIFRDLLWCVVPVPAVVFDGDHQVGKCEVDIVFIDRVDRDGIEATSIQCRHDLRFIATQCCSVLFGSSPLTQVGVTALAPSNHSGCVRHQGGTLLRWKGKRGGSSTIARAIDRGSPDLPVGANKRLTAMKTNLGYWRTSGLRHNETPLGQVVSEWVGTVRETVRRAVNYSAPSPLHCRSNYTKAPELTALLGD